MGDRKLALEWIPGAFAVCRLPAASAVPEWATAAEAALSSITRTDDELSIVTAQDAVPAEVTAERGWVALRIAGTIEFSVTGVMAALCGALAEAGVPVFVVSTYDTDILLVRGRDAGRAVEALKGVAEVTGVE